ncbi:autoinducer binding domain-containing protein [Salmonella enterica]|nr:LuxR family transcriptional regulator [Salmonella enterica subsp. enterica serovar Saintpaul]EKB5403228.1 autoinducer binding domain-containing protein [Salmonella enterica]EKB5474951.1 autoinducer binding domain-containing protein [Salmonella enterica]EKC2614296.1 autoinducer binding domain-containing protein [Salmonella enterica]EKC2692360.1 autoinducer binding domain-containing protein [Salmonella enterica]
MTEILEAYLNKIYVKKYSIIIMNALKDVCIISNLPNEWEHDFIKRKLHLNSEIMLKAKNKITPFKWVAQNMENENIKFLSKKYDIHCGISFIIKISHDFIILTLYFDEDDNHFLRLYNENKKEILFDILSIFENNYNSEVGCSFTLREIEVLNLLKIGKTYFEIAIILGIKERTVRFHISNILTKLDVTSVRYAIFKAVDGGII